MGQAPARLGARASRAGATHRTLLDPASVAQLAWLAQDDRSALDEAYDFCLACSDIGLAIRGCAIGLLVKVRYDDLPADIAGANGCGVLGGLLVGWWRRFCCLDVGTRGCA